jgi:hypothetical protein
MTRSLYLMRHVRSRYTITLSIATMAVDRLDCVVSLAAGSRVRDTQEAFGHCDSQLELVYSLVSWQLPGVQPHLTYPWQKQSSSCSALVCLWFKE